MTKSQPALATHELAIGYPTTHGRSTLVAEGINVQLHPGELVALLGPNGAGKSTLLRTLAGLQKPLRGQVCIGNDDLHRLSPENIARRLAVVLTERIEVGNLSAYGLVALGRHPYTNWRGALTAQDEAIVQWALTAVGAGSLAGRPINELSDGERQKVLIARALAQEARLLILDEPTAFLDLPRRVELLHLLRNLAYTTERAILISTHDLDLALRVADRLWLLPASGTLQVGLPEALVLNHALTETFRREGVEFDPALGAFQLTRVTCGPIGLSGTGPVADWTARALERIGYAVVWGASDLPLQVQTDETGWRVITPGRQEAYSSLEGVIEQVQQRM